MKERIKSNFSDKRWEQFKKDVFEIIKHDPRYPGMLDDHGFNATPIWTVTGQFIANIIPVEKIYLAALADVILLIIMFCFIYYAFGTEMFLVSLFFFGNNFCCTYLFIGGSMLRFDWFVCTIIGICMIQKNKYIAAGSFIAYASLIRIFPVLFGFFLGIKMIVETVKNKKIPVRYLKFFGGFAATIVLFLLLTTTLGNPVNIYKNYSSKIRMHNNLVQANGIGLRLVLISDKTDLSWDKFVKKYTEINPSKNPFMNWVEVKEKIYQQRKLIHYSIIILSIIIMSLIIYKRDDLEASGFAVILLYIVLIPAQYYYCFLLAFFIMLYKRDYNFKNFILISLLILLSIISYIIDIKEVFYLKMFLIISYLYLIYVVIFITAEFYSEYSQFIKSKFFKKNNH